MLSHGSLVLSKAFTMLIKQSFKLLTLFHTCFVMLLSNKTSDTDLLEHFFITVLRLASEHTAKLMIDSLCSFNTLFGIFCILYRSIFDTEETSDLGCTFRLVSVWNVDISETLDLLILSINQDDIQGVQVRADNTAADRLTLWLSSTTLAEAFATLAKDKAYTSGLQNALEHREALTIVTTSDFDLASFQVRMYKATV